MELTSAFNAPASGSGPEAATGGENRSSADARNVSASSTESSSSPSPANEDNYAVTDAPSSIRPDVAEEESEVEHIHPEVQSLNDAQDRRLAEEARNSDENMRARRRLEEDLARRYGDDIRQLRSEIGDLENVLNDSGRVRLGWLRLTRQVSEDPHADLNLLQSTLEGYETRQAEERQALEDRIREQALALQIQEMSSVGTQNQSAQASDTQDQRSLTKEQATERLAFLEDHRPEPTNVLHFRPGGKAEQTVHSDVAAKHEGEISVLRAFVKAHKGPHHNPDAAADHDFDDGFGPCF